MKHNKARFTEPNRILFELGNLARSGLLPSSFGIQLLLRNLLGFCQVSNAAWQVLICTQCHSADAQQDW